MSNSIKVDTSDLRKWTASKTRRDFRQTFTAIESDFQTKIANQFATGTDPDGDPWEPLAPQTILAKKGQGSILVKSGKMRDSFVYKKTATSLEITNESPVFPLHNAGVLGQTERRMLGISAEDKNRMAKRVIGYYKGK